MRFNFIPYTGEHTMRSRLAAFARRAVLPLALAGGCVRLAGDRGVAAAPMGVAFSHVMPRTVVWAWEEPEDLRAADPRSIGVAFLAETLELGGPGLRMPGETIAPGVILEPRRQPLRVADSAPLMAVVRVEARAGFRDTPQLRAQTASLIAEAATRPGVRALQVDFDATRSQRAFYSGVLRELRPQLPAGMPLSITALTSWCDGSASDWLRSMPIDEAVPMAFRLGGHAKPYGAKSTETLREPACRRALGLSTDESWPASSAFDPVTPRRIYLFSPTPWTDAQLSAAAALNDASFDLATARPAALRVRDDAAHTLHGINDTGLTRPSHATPEEQP